ncbi:hypothetical protein NC796_21060 [Aliifodinibius sp. S!AR15-10]|uniref:hypothetical protein n=1 Tax=Aliifodinibius sp. S!AR15-10 TaxID=2950437 RepID=UPI002863544D|nr:hypothetical protein [Aliifodinibius sp. S!AR15-10]MDR8393657.1 hypothetical protein [Aliifodinibius sp. S!AR15-10]
MEKSAGTSNPTEHVLEVIKIEDEKQTWRVVEQEFNCHAVVAKRGEKISWTSQSNLIFQFPSNYTTFVTPIIDDQDFTLIAEGEETLPAGETFTLKVKNDAPFGRLSYAVLVKQDCVLAEGGSEPSIIFKER